MIFSYPLILLSDRNEHTAKTSYNSDDEMLLA